jgi:hypothetical protein
VKLANLFGQRPASVEGDKFAIPIETELSDAGGHRDEDDDVPVPDYVRGKFGYATYSAYLRTVRLTGPARLYGGSVVDPMTREVKGLVQAARLDTEMDMFMGKDGAHAGCVSAASATSLTVDSWWWLKKGMRVDVLIASSGNTGAGVVNAKITAAARNLITGYSVLTLNKNLTAYGSIDTTYSVYRTNEYGKKTHGFRDIISASNPGTGNYLEIDRTVTTEWQSYSDAAAGASASGQLFVSAQTMLAIDGDEEAGLIIVHPFVFNDLVKLGVNNKLYMGQVKKFELWGNTVAINDVPVVKNRFCPPHTAYFLNIPTWYIYHPPGMNVGGQWDLSGGADGTRMQRVAGKWAHEALWVRVRQYICDRPNANGVITGLNYHPRGTV